MRKLFIASPLVLSALCALGLIGCSSGGQLLSEILPGTPSQPVQATEHANGIVQDWSTQHTLYPRVGSVQALDAVQKDPRAILAWQEAQLEASLPRSVAPRNLLNIGDDVHPDWSISLGTGGVAPSMFPAKFSFSVSVAPDCTNDFVVFPINVAGSGTQPNIVAFDNLYSGTTPTNGICNRTPAVGPPSDDGVSGTVVWSYNVTAAGGVVATSPALSLDGTRVVFVETGSGTTAHFHVLAWASGNGVSAASLQSVTSPVSITSGFSSTAPAAGSGTVTDLALNVGTTQSDTLSSPFIDYTNDLAYVGNDSGVLFRIKNVLCEFPSCSGAGSPAPSLDTSWNSTGALTVCSGALSGPVIDGGTGNIFVGCSDGKIYGFTPAGVALTNPSVTVGNGSATGGVVDPPLVDAVKHYIYGVAGASSGGTSVVVQASSIDLSAAVTATLGAGGSFNLHSPAFDNHYFTSVDPTQWYLYEWALNAAGNNIELWGVTFNSSHVMNSGTPTFTDPVGGSSPVEFSPVSEFLNGSTEQVFVSGITIATPNFVEYNMNAYLFPFPTGFPPSGATGATTSEAGGTSGMIVDNNSSQAQASSIYFGNLGSNTAVKLTQSGLN